MILCHSKSHLATLPNACGYVTFHAQIPCRHELMSQENSHIATSLTPDGYRICVLFLKLFHKVYAPLAAGVLEPFPGDSLMPKERICYLDRLYRAVDQALQKLLDHVGVKKVG